MFGYTRFLSSGTSYLLHVHANCKVASIAQLIGRSCTSKSIALLLV